MKRAILLLVTFFSIISVSALAENCLLLTNQQTREVNVFRNGSYLVFELKADRSMYEGFIRDITDSSIVLDDAQVSLSQINIFAGSTKARVVAGRVVNKVFDFGLSITIGESQVLDWALCSPNRVVRVRNYREWTASIVQEGQPNMRNDQKVQDADTVQTQPVPIKPEKLKGKKHLATKDDVYGD